MSKVLEIDKLTVEFNTKRGLVTAINDISFSIAAGETVCLVGESGSGKTVTSKAILRLTEYENGVISQGKILLHDENIVDLTERQLKDIRGKRVAMVFQEPMAAFDPVYTIGEQIIETIIEHDRVSHKEATSRAEELLYKVGITEAASRLKQYPNELSGGMLQRAMIAMALSCKPDLLIADEPTTALDVTIQAQILQLLQQLKTEFGMSILLITHDLGVAAQIADRIIVMYAGQIVEEAPTEHIFKQPKHPYTIGLLQSLTRLDQPRYKRLIAMEGSVPSLEQMPEGCLFHPRCKFATQACVEHRPKLENNQFGKVACFHVDQVSLKIEDDKNKQSAFYSEEKDASSNESIFVEKTLKPFIEVNHLRKHYKLKQNHLFAQKKVVQAVEDVSFTIYEKETFGLVGESGSGKSTLGKLIVQLEQATSGKVVVDSTAVNQLKGKHLRAFRKDLQIIFQDPYGSLDPRWTVGESIAEPLVTHENKSSADIKARVYELLELVGLSRDAYDKHPHQFSGGQRQRIAIARAIALNPKFILADEAVSALDVSVQAQIINLLQDLQKKLGLTILFIGHGLQVVKHIADRVGVMYLGQIVEIGPSEQVFANPAHPYTKALINSIPEPQFDHKKPLSVLEGEIPSPANPPSGCHFHTRCPHVQEKCKQEQSELAYIADGRQVRCHFPFIFNDLKEEISY